MIDRLFLGKEFDYVHKFKDAPARWLGPNHRKLFHDHMTNILLGIAYGPEAFIAGELHDWLDFSTTELKRKKAKKKKRKTKTKKRRRR